MKKVDYNIEFGHIYVNEMFTNEHYTSAALAQKTIMKLKSEGKSYVITVLIDDYNPTDSILNIKKFAKNLRAIGINPDYFIMESSLVNYKDMALEEMNGKIKRLYTKYIENNQKCPCSFLVSIWHLLRLGAFDDVHIDKTEGKKPFQAERIITILPERYRSIEKKALDIIKSTKYVGYVAKAEYIYF